MDTTEKVRVNRLRRMAERQGYQLVKIRRRDPLAIDYGRYYITSQQTGTAVTGMDTAGRASMTLDDVDAWLSHTKPRPAGS